MQTTNPIDNETASVSTGNSSAFPLWHTAVLIGMLAVLVVLSSRTHSAAGIRIRHRIPAYLLIAAAEWAMVIWIEFGRRIQGERLSRLLGDFAIGWRTILRDIGIAVVFLFVANIFLGILGRLLGATANQSLRNLLPHTSAEEAAFLALSVTAAFCEELICRGYLQRQFTAWTGSISTGIALQGIAFGACHAYQGPKMILVITVYGCLFGLLATWRKSLRPGMIAHFLQDGVGGLVLAKLIRK